MLLGRVVASNATLSRNSWPGLYLGDGDVTLPLVLLRPNITWLHQLVCITSWKCIQTRSMAYLEVDSIHRLVTVPIPILPAYMTWQSLLASCYPTHNRPTYAGPYPVQRALSKRTTSKSWSSKKSKSFVVAGRVAAISPVSTQLDSQYFFVEIEAASDPTTGPASPLVRQFISVLMAGHTATFHSFLWPGLEIVLTDLVKVFAKECNMYMLHTTTSAASSYSSPHTPPHDAHTTLHHASVAPTSHLPPLHIFRALPRYDRQSSSSSLHYTGQVTRRVCDDSFELNHSVVVLFAHFPLPNRCAGLRVGATVTIFQGHRLGPSLIGLCSRSSVVLDEFASAPTPMHLHPRSSRVQELAFHQVPLTTVAYLLELSQDMLARFSRYGATGAASNNRDPNGRHSPAWDVFQDATVRKQTLLRQLASSAGVVWRPRPTVWDICFKVVPHRIEFTPPLTSAYAFEYHLAKFKQEQYKRGHGNEVDWNDLHTRPKVTEALVQYRISADNDTTFVWVATLYEDGSLHHHPHNAIWTSMATHYETMHPPSSLHVIPLQNPSERPLATHVPPQPHPSALEDRLVSTYGIVTDLAIVPAHEYHHIRSKASSTASHDEMILQVTMQDLNAPDVVVVGLWLNSTRCCQAGWPSGLALGVHLVLHRVKVKVRKRGFKLDMVQ
ncbi:hypothetical protein DYB28_005543, partial [Aphanomyces astaci]